LLAYIGLGSNLEDPRRQIEKALEAIREADKTKLTSVYWFRVELRGSKATNRKSTRCYS